MRRNHTPYLLLACLVMFVAGCTTPEDAPAVLDRPNILWITVEDMSLHLGSYGDSLAHTPNLDRLAAAGVRYTNAFATAPVCSPSRTALITGMYQSSIGGHQHRAGQSYDNFEHQPYRAVPPPHVKAFTEYLRAAGYYCTNNAKTDYNFGNPLTAWDESSRTAHWRNRPDSTQPFFAVFNTNRTHESRVWPNPEEESMLDPDAVVLPPYYPDTPLIRRDYARLHDNVARMDRWAGDILRQLEDDGLADNTIVFFFSDHGDGIPRGKRWLQDSGLQTPLLIRWPDHLTPGAVDDQLVSFIDLPPTVLSLAGVEVPDHLQGRVFLGPQAIGPPRAYIFAARDRMDESHDMRRAVRNHQYKYIRNFFPDRPYLLPNQYRERMPLMQELRRLHEAGELEGPAAALFQPTKPEEELYDVTRDPYEIHNLADDPARAEVLADMRGVLERWQQDTGDMGLIPETNLAEMMWPGGVQPVTEPPVFTPGNEEEGSITFTISSSTEGASIAYTTEAGDAPHWHLYSGPITLPVPATLRAVAVRYGYKRSEEVSATFGIQTVTLRP